MINLRNQGDFPIFLQIKGTLTTTSGLTQAGIVTPAAVASTQAAFSQESIFIPFNATVKAVWAGERIPGTSAANASADAVDLLYFPPISSTSGGITGTVSGISFCQSPAIANATSTVLFYMASSTLAPTDYSQVPLITYGSTTQTVSATGIAAGGYGAIFTSATQFNPPQVARGGQFMLVCRTVATTPGVDFTCVVELTRIRNSAYSQDATQIGTYGQDNDIY